MQTFLPYADFVESAKCLDYRRLGKQRVEAYQIINILTGKTAKKGWINHPAVLMWKGYENALKQYCNCCINEWIKKGYKNNMQLYTLYSKDILYPFWLGKYEFHSSHRSNLLRKDFTHYSKFGWTEDSNISYYWPVTKEIEVL